MEKNQKKLKKMILNEFENKIDSFIENIITEGIASDELIEDLGMIRVLGKGDYLIVVAAIPDTGVHPFDRINYN